MELSPTQNNSEDAELKPSYYYFLGSLLFFVFWFAFTLVILYSEATGFKVWNWYWYVFLIAVISLVLSIALVLGKLWVIWIAQVMKTKTQNLKNKAMSLPEMKKEFRKEIEELKKVREKLFIA